jgi:hypothetical protein
VKAEGVRSFLHSADDLLAAQQGFMPDPLLEGLRALTEAYIAAWGRLIDARQPRGQERRRVARTSLPVSHG